jgi:ubiquitin-protein ligase E3 A
LLAFATGSDRAPVNGLKSMKFYIIKDLENSSDKKLPTAHTCFNHLVIPDYSTKEILKLKM